MASHTKWRLYITAAGGGGNYCAIAELQFYDSSLNQLSFAGGTASASSIYSAGYEAALAFNGNNSDFWHSGAVPSGGSPQWLRFDFASAVDVALIRIKPRPSSPTQAPSSFLLQSSDDGSSWNTEATLSNTWSDDLYKSFLITSVGLAAGTYKTWGIRVNTSSTGVVGCTELALRSTPGGTNLALASAGAIASATSNYPGYPASYAIDGNTSTFWDSWGGVPQVLQIDLLAAAAIVELSWKARPDGGGDYPLTFDLVASNDFGATWTTIQSFTTPNTWTNGETRTFGLTLPSTFKPRVMFIT